MEIKDLKYDKGSSLIYCNSNLGYYVVQGMELASLVAFTLDEKLVENEKMLNYFAAILEAMFVENPLLFKYVQHTIKYKHRGKQQEVSFNIYIDAVNTVRKMREQNIYEDLVTDFYEI